MDNIQLLFDGDIRGYRTGKDCVLELSKNPIWTHALTPEEIECVKNESDGYLDIVDSFIDTAQCNSICVKTYTLTWNMGSIYAVAKETPEQELNQFYGN